MRLFKKYFFYICTKKRFILYNIFDIIIITIIYNIIKFHILILIIDVYLLHTLQ